MIARRAAVLACFAAALVLAPSAYGDAVYHSQHLALTPVGDAPLRSGVVENIHANGPQVFAHEVYALNGATPRTAYDVTLLLHPLDPSCSGSAIEVPEITLTTNAAGNAAGVNTFDVATVEHSGSGMPPTASPGRSSGPTETPTSPRAPP